LWDIRSNDDTVVDFIVVFFDLDLDFDFGLGLWGNGECWLALGLLSLILARC